MSEDDVFEDAHDCDNCGQDCDCGDPDYCDYCEECIEEGDRENNPFDYEDED